MSGRISHLYRYRSFSGENRDHLRRTLIDGDIYFSCPAAFNDPFDCRPSFVLEASELTTRKIYERALSRQMPDMSRQVRRAKARSLTKDPQTNFTNSENLSRFHAAYEEAVTNKIGMLCLSEVPDDILMWAHYADSHRGLCLQFDATHSFCERAHPVLYREDRPGINPTEQADAEMMEHALLTKSTHWKYERERRLIRYQGGAGICQVPQLALTGLIFGAQMPQSDRHLIRSWVAGRSTPSQLSESRLSDRKFAIQVGAWGANET